MNDILNILDHWISFVYHFWNSPMRLDDAMWPDVWRKKHGCMKWREFEVPVKNSVDGKHDSKLADTMSIEAELSRVSEVFKVNFYWG